LKGGAGGGGVGGKGGGGGRGEKWTKPCMHIWIIKEKWKKKIPIAFDYWKYTRFIYICKYSWLRCVYIDGKLRNFQLLMTAKIKQHLKNTFIQWQRKWLSFFSFLQKTLLMKTFYSLNNSGKSILWHLLTKLTPKKMEENHGPRFSQNNEQFFPTFINASMLA
jgi:hypothetical protein